MGFYQEITTTYGIHTTRKMKQWSKLNNKLAAARNQRIFLHECKRKGLKPRHISQNTKHLFQLYDVTQRRLMNNIEDFNHRLIIKILNFEIQYTINKITHLQNQQDAILNNLNNVNSDIIREFLHKQNISYNKRFHKVKFSNISKINKLQNRQNSNITTQEKWLKNYTRNELPDRVRNMLALGPKFALPTNNKDVKLENLLADTEYILSHIEIQNRDNYRAKVTNVVTNFMMNNRIRDNNQLDQDFTYTKQYLKQQTDLIVLKSDKGGTTVVMYRDEYNNKMLDLLGETSTFKKINKDPTHTVQTKANKFVTEMETKRNLTKLEAKELRIYNTVCPKIYGNPKIHKPNVPLRPIVSGVQSPTIQIAKFIAKILNNAYNNSNEYYTGDTFRFAEFMENKTIPLNYKVVSLDVINLFGNITKELSVRIISQKWNIIKDFAYNLTKNYFIKLIEFVLDNNFFSFQQVYYKQVFGCAMGSKLSPILSQYIMDDLLDQCLPKLSFNIPFMKKFVDDLITAIPNNGVEEILNVFNNYDNNLKFTIEEEDINHSVPFLDTRVIRDHQGIIKLDWYQKSTSSGRYINFHSQHSIVTKINFIKQMKKRIVAISNIEFRNKNLKKFGKVLIENAYPNTLVTNLLYRTTNRKNNNRNITNIQEPLNTKKTYCTIQNITNLTHKIIKIFSQENIIIIKKNFKTINNLYSKLKDSTPLLMQSNVVYQLQCSTCDNNKFYIGQTSQLLKNRITGHRSDIKKNLQRCTLATHVNDLNHNINFQDVKILNIEQNSIKRNFLEMYQINKNKNSINKKSDIQHLSNIYVFLLKHDFK